MCVLCQSAGLSCPSVVLSVCLSVCPLVRLWYCLVVCLPAYITLCLFLWVNLSVYLSLIIIIRLRKSSKTLKKADTCPVHYFFSTFSLLFLYLFTSSMSSLSSFSSISISLSLSLCVCVALSLSADHPSFSTFTSYCFLFIGIGMRIIISEKKPMAPVSFDVHGDINNLNTESGRMSGMNEQAGDSNSKTSIPFVSTSSTSSSGKEDEEAAVWRVYSIVCSSLSSGSRSSCEWIEDKTRFKDYVTKPKPSGWGD